MILSKPRSPDTFCIRRPKREALHLEPELSAAHHNLATVLVARGDRDEAEYHLERAIENNPSDVQKAMVHLRKASESQDPRICQAALDLLRELNRAL